MGVVTLVTIDYGRIFGPLPKSPIISDPVSHIGSLTRQNAQQIRTLKINPDDRGDLSKPMEWLCYIHPAKTEDEQNMEAYIKEGQIYYRALRMIKAQEELLIWYSKDFALLIGIPEIQRPFNGEELNYSCPYCSEKYEYPFPLRAHVRFKCPRRRVWSNADSLVTIPLYKKTNDNSRRSPKLEDRNRPESRVYSIHSQELSKSKRNSADFDGPECSPAKRLTLDIQDHRHSDFAEKSFDCNQNEKPTSISNEENQSAFTKVDKMSPGSFHLSPRLESSVPTSSREVSFALSMVPPSSMSSARNHLRPTTGMLLDSRLPVFPMMPPIHPAMMHMPRPSVYGGIHLNSRLPNSDSSMGFKQKSKDGTDLKNIENSNPGLTNASKSMVLDKPRPPYPMVRAINPIMEKMMHTAQPSVQSPLSSVNVLQNCCAQCSASFRMTSDLVYHMRSHHKREFDPMKRKREEKLRCNICSESFRERHHLTRHMTSHL